MQLKDYEACKNKKLSLCYPYGGLPSCQDKFYAGIMHEMA